MKQVLLTLLEKLEELWKLEKFEKLSSTLEKPEKLEKLLSGYCLKLTTSRVGPLLIQLFDELQSLFTSQL